MRREKLILSTLTKQIPSILLGAFMIILTLIASFFQMNRNELILLSCLYLSVLHIAVYDSSGNFNLKIRTNDLVISIYLLYNIILIVLSKHAIDPIHWFKWCGIILLYMITRRITKTVVVIVFIVLSVIIQSLYGLGQQFDLFHSNHSLFSITGSFSNPGPFGGYLGIGFILLFILIFTQKKRLIKCLSGIFLIIIGIGILLSDSRAAWVSVAIPSLIYLISKIPQKKYRFSCYILSIILLFGVSIGLFHYKKKSAEGRLMIWEITLSSVSDHILTGKGPFTFPANYMYHQAAYFEKHPDSDKTRIAANNTYTFNDFLRILYEQGIIGLILFIWILYNAFSTQVAGNSVLLCLKYGLMSLLIFSFFSYPSDILPLKYLFPLFLGFLPGESLFIPLLKKYHWTAIRYINLLLSLLLIISTAFAVQQNFKINKLIENLYYESDEFTSKELDKLYPAFQYNKELVLKYSKVLYTDGAFIKAVPVLVRASKMSPSSLLLCDLGMAYMHTNQLHEAEKTFITASRMTPSYILPYYHLFLFYANQNKTENQIRVANHIDRMSVKIENETTRRIKQQIKRFLESTH